MAAKASKGLLCQDQDQSPFLSPIVLFCPFAEQYTRLALCHERRSSLVGPPSTLCEKTLELPHNISYGQPMVASPKENQTKKYQFFLLVANWTITHLPNVHSDTIHTLEILQN